MTCAEYIYKQLRLAGVTKEGACAVLANVQAESAFIVNNVEDNRGWADDAYTNAVDSGSRSREQFANDGLGYGVYQLTYPSRKAKYYDFAKARNSSIGSLETQVEFMIKEFKEDFSTCWNMICSSNDLYGCTDKLLKVWENPRVKDYTNRRNNASSWYSKVRQLEEIVAGGTPNTSSKGGGDMSKVEQYTQEAINIAEDNSHGYSWGGWGPQDYDCGHLVITVVQNAGIPVKSRGASSTGNMRSVFLSCGFADVTGSCNLGNGAGMQRGDILLNDASHAAIYVGNGKVVHARSSEGNSFPGDQSGNEIRVQPYWNFPWSIVMRFVGDNTATVTQPSSVPFTGGASVPVSTAPSSSLLRKGSKGGKVKEVQENLIKLGYDLGKWGADGDFGNDTYQAVRKFQTDHNIEIDGIVGPETLATIDKALSELGKKKESQTKENDDYDESAEYEFGEIVKFVGKIQFVSSNFDVGVCCRPGEAKITAIAVGAKHPYHLAKTADSESNVYGWVDKSDIRKIKGNQ